MHHRTRQTATAAVLVLLIAAASAGSAATFFPLNSSAFWTLTDADAGSTMYLIITGPEFFHGAYCIARSEVIDGVLVGTTFWSEDDQGRLVLHGLRYLTGEVTTYYFLPGFVYLDPMAAPGEVVTSMSHVFEVDPPWGDRWWGELTVELTCVDRDPIATPLGTFPAITANTTWIDSPIWAPWRFGNDSRVSYAMGVGVARIAGTAGLHDWLLTAVQNVDVTDAPPLAPLALSAAPNPFNPQTSLRFTLPEAGRVRLDLFDARGRKVADLIAGDLAAGSHDVIWRGTDLLGRPVASGVYHAVLSFGTERRSIAVTLVQ